MGYAGPRVRMLVANVITIGVPGDAGRVPHAPDGREWSNARSAVEVRRIGAVSDPRLYCAGNSRYSGLAVGLLAHVVHALLRLISSRSGVTAVQSMGSGVNIHSVGPNLVL